MFIKGVVSVFSYELDIPNPTGMAFGAWTWDIPCDLTRDEYDVIEPELIKYLDKLVKYGHIRGAEYGLVEPGES